MRLICSEARVDSQRLWLGNLEPDDWEKLVDATGQMLEAPLLIDDASGITPGYVRKVARQVTQEYEDTHRHDRYRLPAANDRRTTPTIP